MNYDDVAEMLRSHPQAHFGSGATPAEIARAELDLGLVFPGSLKAFLEDLGWGGAASWELYGLGSQVPPYLDIVKVTLSERTEMEPALQHHLLPIMNDGGGGLYCLDTRTLNSDGECPVVFRDHESSRVNEVAAAFPTWLAENIGRPA